MVQHHHIVHVAQAGPDVQDLLEVMVQVVEVEIGEELAGQIADGNADSPLDRCKEVIAGEIARVLGSSGRPIDDAIQQVQDARNLRSVAGAFP